MHRKGELLGLRKQKEIGEKKNREKRQKRKSEIEAASSYQTHTFYNGGFSSYITEIEGDVNTLLHTRQTKQFPSSNANHAV